MSNHEQGKAMKTEDLIESLGITREQYDYIVSEAVLDGLAAMATRLSEDGINPTAVGEYLAHSALAGTHLRASAERARKEKA